MLVKGDCYFLKTAIYIYTLSFFLNRGISKFFRKEKPSRKDPEITHRLKEAEQQPWNRGKSSLHSRPLFSLWFRICAVVASLK